MPQEVISSGDEDFEAQQDGAFRYVRNEKLRCSATAAMVDRFRRDGFLIVRNLFDRSEIEKLVKAAEVSPEFQKAAYTVGDADARRYSVVQWPEVGKDILGLCARAEKVVGVAEQILNEGEVFLYSARIIMKDALQGGRVEWHQDYGYFYNNDILTPDLLNCYIALTKNDRENGGLQVLKGSHRCGRIDHTNVGGQLGADPKRIPLLEKRFERVYCDLKPGDAVYFHSNMLHMSERNTSQFRRWNLVYGYSTVENTSHKPHYNALYTEPLVKLPCDVVKKCDDLTIDARTYLRPGQNPALRDTEQLVH